MSNRNKAIITGVFFSILILIGGVVAVFIAFKQNTSNPVAPTVPQIKPHAEGNAVPVLNPDCTKTFVVAAQQSSVCDSLTATPTSGNAPLTVSFTLTGHPVGGGSIVNYSFNFGDGTTSLGTPQGTVTHTFSSEGTFTTKGAVTDNLSNVSPDIASCQVIITTGHITYKYKTCETGVNNAKVCKEEDCVPNSTPCAGGKSTCTSDTDCQPKYQHKVCLGTACSSADCSPSTTQCADTCTSDANCVTVVTPPPPVIVVATHKECRNRACVVVSGSAVDTCTSDVSCQPAPTPPPVPPAGSTAATFGAIVLGVGALIVGLLIAL